MSCNAGGCSPARPRRRPRRRSGGGAAGSRRGSNGSRTNPARASTPRRRRPTAPRAAATGRRAPAPGPRSAARSAPRRRRRMRKTARRKAARHFRRAFSSRAGPRPMERARSEERASPGGRKALASTPRADRLPATRSIPRPEVPGLEGVPSSRRPRHETLRDGEEPDGRCKHDREHEPAAIGMEGPHGELRPECERGNPYEDDAKRIRHPRDDAQERQRPPPAGAAPHYQDRGRRTGDQHGLQGVQARARRSDGYLRAVDSEIGADARYVETDQREKSLREERARNAEQPPDMLAVADDAREGEHRQHKQTADVRQAVGLDARAQPCPKEQRPARGEQRDEVG